jgi:hypothetical protein
MLIITKVFEPALGQIKVIETEMEVKFLSMVDSATDFPTLDIESGNAVMVKDTKHLFVYLNGIWNDQGVYDVKDLLNDRLTQVIS